RARLLERVREAVADARDLGMTEDELLALVRSELDA
ncbi:GntR family transcriptional regulator, partial [Streptomyces sp. SID7499]|nr:GntR family transcriptional regulator [Streptomyces sp. SID7499]